MKGLGLRLCKIVEVGFIDNMRERTVRLDGIGNTITGVLKDFYVLEIS